MNDCKGVKNGSACFCKASEMKVYFPSEHLSPFFYWIAGIVVTFANVGAVVLTSVYR
jgi:hypothetical protein